GAGGSEVTLEFLGRGELDGVTDLHRYATPPDASEDDRRSEMARMIRLGLVRFMLLSDREAGLELADAGRTVPVQVQPHDPWNNWVVDVELSGELDSESRELSYEVGGEVRASRVTPEWKLEFELGGD